MFKKLLVILTLICLALSLSACKAVQQTTEPEFSSLPPISSEVPTTTTVPTAEVNPVSLQIAQLVQDGNGILNPDLSPEQIDSLLVANSIDYTKSQVSDKTVDFTLSDGSYFLVGQEGNFTSTVFHLNCSKKGLILGEDESKIVELYGQPNSLTTVYGRQDYEYFIKNSQRFDNAKIELHIQTKDGMIVSIAVSSYNTQPEN
ncbi:MAG: hypothetical protein LBS74_02255 [Oscillospiraceae bacterium]|jgi:hypothetical protein|nr:hypothetical protein [Oscillospiraceae bacterium]